jgi:peroxin-1
MIMPPSGDPSSASHFAGGILRFQQRGTTTDTEARDSFTWAIGKERKHEIEVRSEIPRPVATTALFPSFEHNLSSQVPDMIGVDSLVKQCMSNLTLCSSILLTGGIGSGKTSITQLLSHRLREDFLFNVTYFPCERLVTDETRVSTIKETLTRLFMSASWCARLGGQSVVVLDDLDKICPVEAELQVGNDNERSRQVTELLCSIVRQYCSIHSGVALLATAKSKDAVHNLIIGGHITNDIVQIKAPSKEIRRDILQEIASEGSRSKSVGLHRVPHSRNSSDPSNMSESSWMDPSNTSSRPGSSSSATDGFRLSSSLDLLDIAGKTDGYMPADLVLLVARARNQCLTRSVMAADSNDSSLTITKADFESALQNFTPTSLRNVTLTHSNTTFSSIGGLHTTRKTLLETLLYPTKYAPIFAKSPLRLRSGLLLYGYPGCGKTLLASAVAGECNLNFISVKGPEILNKYIGASEKSVRDLFERAQAAKPCVLFFDEFDSIAPKRGHDSTGVTDRVVNQMLTQMDGAEGLDGVYVLAATSRPDLIDPALLRPGRLDKSLLCDMPDTDDRLDILRAVSTKLSLTAAVSNKLLTIAEKTSGFTGADLQALMYNAHLEAIHDLLGDKNTHQNKSTLTNGNSHSNHHNQQQQRKSSTSSVSSSKSRQTGSKKHEFTQFLYGTDADIQKQQPGSQNQIPKDPKLESKAAIAAKLDELKLQRKRDRAALRGDYSFLHTHPNTKDNHSNNPSTDAPQGTEEGSGGKENAGVVIEWTHVERALSTTRSSISAAEKKRLEAIYTEFVVGRKGDMPNGEGGREVGGRSSLM